MRVGAARVDKRLKAKAEQVLARVDLRTSDDLAHVGTSLEPRAADGSRLSRLLVVDHVRSMPAGFRPAVARETCH